MAWGLELRVPFVDQQLVDSISPIPAAIRLARGKQLLRDAVTEIPEWIRTQSKRGFCFPFEEWVTYQWGDLFKRVKRNSPVELNSWFRVWTIFTLEHFLRTNHIQCLECDSSELVSTEILN
jgi:asparagine synthase (glutamine-hydrolysing)